MNTPKLWTYYNDGERCGIVTSVHRDGGSPSLAQVGKLYRIGSTLVTLAERGDILCVSTGDVIVEPGEMAYIRPQTLADMRYGWTNDIDEFLVLSAGEFVKALPERSAHDNGHLASVRLGGSLFSREAELDHRARAQQHARVASVIAQPEQRVHIDYAPEQRPAKPHSMALYDVLAAFPGVTDVTLTADRNSASGPIAAELQVGAAFNVVALQDHLHERVAATTLDRLHIEVNRVAFICDVCGRETPNEEGACDKCWSAAQEPAVAPQSDIWQRMEDVNRELLAAQVCPPGWTMIRSAADVDRFAGTDLAIRFQTGVELYPVQLRAADETSYFIEHRFKGITYNGEQPGSLHKFAGGGHVRLPVQAPTEPTPREPVLQPLDEHAAAYWRAIQTARNAIDEASAQLQEARRIRTAHEQALPTPWIDTPSVTDLLIKVRKAIPDLPATSAALDGGCADCGVSQST